ncbi:hypothetical protein V7193_15580, partial [Bacillus velezensis]
FTVISIFTLLGPKQNSRRVQRLQKIG